MQQQPSFVVSGGTGFVGGVFLDFLRNAGARTKCLTRSPGRAQLPSGVEAIGWDALDRDLVDVDVVVHLAGSKAVGTRYTEAQKRRILESRVETTNSLVSAMRRLEKPPRAFVCASAVGYYGHAPWGRVFHEEDPPGDDFLARVCQQWEKEAAAATTVGVRVVHARLGIVMGKKGALEAMAAPFKMFVGGRIASGQQPISWIDVRDVARALWFCAENDSISGPVNFVAPQATNNERLSALLAETLHRPNLFPVPKLALQAVFGEGAEALVHGQHVTPARLQKAGFEFEHSDLQKVVQAHLG